MRRISFILSLSLLAAYAIGQTEVEHHVQNGDVSIVYETEGKGDPVVFLAGGPGVTPYSVKPAQDFASLEHLAVLVHQRGTGKTVLPKADPEHVNVNAFVEDIEAVRKDLKADKITIVGHSWGGMLAMAYTAAHPDHVSHLVLMDSGGADLSFSGVFQDNINMRLNADDIALRNQSFKESRAKDRMGDLHYLQSILPGYFYSRENALDFMKTLKIDDYNSALRPLLFGYNITKDIVKYHGPVDIIQGRQDPIDASTVLLNSKYLPQAKVHWIERAGHIPWLEQAAAFQKTFTDVLSTSDKSN